MRELIDAFENLLVSASVHGGDAKEGVDSMLERIDWKVRLRDPAPSSYPVIEQRLAEVCGLTGGYGSISAGVCEAVLAHADRLEWVVPWGEYLEHPDMGALVQNFAYTALIGPGCILPADDLYMGLSLQGPDLLYPMHAHQAEEIYWIVGGHADWKIGIDPWFPVEPGDICVHATGMRHAMQTNAEPMLTVWAWWTHIESAIVIVRG